MKFNLVGFLVTAGVIEVCFVVGRITLSQIGHDLLHINSLPESIDVEPVKHIAVPAAFGLPISVATAGVAAITSGSVWMFAAIPTFVVTTIVTALTWVKISELREDGFRRVYRRFLRNRRRSH